MVASVHTPLVGTREAASRRRHLLAKVTAGAVAVGLLVCSMLGSVILSRTHSVPGATSTASYKCSSGTKQDAGYVKLANKEDDHYFYWYFESRSNPSKDPLVLWLTGGAGGSSMLALLTENGPCTVNADDLTTTPNKYSWTNEANVIWLDQPTNAGFSHGVATAADYTQEGVSENIYWFLQGFLEKHPELVDREFFISGESYAGHYIPVAAHYILQQNKLGTAQDGWTRINLQGVSIGNGLVNPLLQFEYFVAQAEENRLNITLLTGTQIAQMKADARECVALARTCQETPTSRSVCVDAQACMIQKLVGPYVQANHNCYDMRLPCDPVANPLCYDFSPVTKYLDSERVREFLNVSPDVGGWLTINPNISAVFASNGDWSMDFHTYVADLLNDDLRVLIYAGDADLMCNWQGNQAWTKALEWKGKKGFNAAEERAFVTHDPLMANASAVDAGVVRSFENFAFLRLYNAGHMVPMDQPAVSLEMINKFFKGEQY